MSQAMAFNSGYLRHLAALAQEAKERTRGMPPFKLMLAVALFTHIALLAPIYVMDLREPIPATRQVQLAFGVEEEKEQASNPGSADRQMNAVNRMDQLFAPPAPRQPRAPSATQPKAPTPKLQQSAAAPLPAATHRRQDSGYRRSAAPRTSAPAPGQTGLGSTRSQVQEIITKYEQLLSGWINSHKLNQSFTLPKGLRGRVVVRLRIDRLGKVLFHSIERSSGYAELDNAALAAVSRASPVPPVPEAYPGGSQLEFLIPINIIVQ